MKLWIDEDLTPRLVDPAHAHGYEATSNREQGLLGATDAALYEVVVDGDYVFVTNDEQDFRRLCRAHDLHPGLIVLPERIRVEQVAMFERVPGRRPAAGWSTASSKSTTQPKAAATTHSPSRATDSSARGRRERRRPVVLICSRPQLGRSERAPRS